MQGEAIRRLKLQHAVRRRLDNNPTWYYTPSAGQMAFHHSQHAVRFLCPGNGWGKTVACGHEVQAWMTHSDRWRQTPKRQITAVWFPEDYKQFSMLFSVLQEKCWGPLPQYREHKFHTVTWPNGCTLYVCPKDRSWKKVQGPPIDLVIFDEHFPRSIYTEMQVRRRGERKTEIIIAATMTLGLTWEYRDIYRKWLDHHHTQGLDEQQAMHAQAHPSIFCWPKGGIGDNPSMTAEDRRHMDEDIVYSSPKEKLVRTGGGFQDWRGDAVFDEAGVAWLKAQREAVEKARPTLISAGSIMVQEKHGAVACNAVGLPIGSVD